MKRISLTNEEIRKIMEGKRDNPQLNFANELNKAQLKKVAEYLDKGLVMEHESELMQSLRRTKHWQALLEEVK